MKRNQLFGAVDKDSTEWLFTEQPHRECKPGETEESFWDISPEGEEDYTGTKYLQLPKGTLKVIFGKEITWNDNPKLIDLRKPSLFSQFIDCILKSE